MTFLLITFVIISEHNLFSHTFLAIVSTKSNIAVSYLSSKFLMAKHDLYKQ